MAIQRAILDSFWASEPQTVNKNLLEARRAVMISKRLGFPAVRPFRPMGPFPLDDIVMLERLTDPG